MPEYCPSQQLTPASDKWQNDLFSCEKKSGHCIKTFMCPMCVLAQSRADMDGSSCIYNFCCQATFNPVNERYHLRHQYRIEGSAISDYFLTCFCQQCVIAQIAREVEIRGRIQNLAGITTTSDWSTGLCDFSLECLLGIICPIIPMILMNAARTKFDDSSCCFNFCCDRPAASYSQIRSGYMIQGGCIGDWIMTCMLLPCAAARVMREVEKRGLCINKSAPCQPVAQAMK